MLKECSCGLQYLQKEQKVHIFDGNQLKLQLKLLQQFDLISNLEYVSAKHIKKSPLQF
jgi:hypothetical protein